jgi:hypothetical protein
MLWYLSRHNQPETDAEGTTVFYGPFEETQACTVPEDLLATMYAHRIKYGYVVPGEFTDWSVQGFGANELDCYDVEIRDPEMIEEKEELRRIGELGENSLWNLFCNRSRD